MLLRRQDSLAEVGYTSVVATNARAALIELDLNRAQFAAVFSDVVMNGMDGNAMALMPFWLVRMAGRAA